MLAVAKLKRDEKKKMSARKGGWFRWGGKKGSTPGNSGTSTRASVRNRGIQLTSPMSFRPTQQQTAEVKRRHSDESEEQWSEEEEEDESKTGGGNVDGQASFNSQTRSSPSQQHPGSQQQQHPHENGGSSSSSGRLNPSSESTSSLQGRSRPTDLRTTKDTESEYLTISDEVRESG